MSRVGMERKRLKNFSEKYEDRGFFEIDMKYVKDDFVTDVELISSC